MTVSAKTARGAELWMGPAEGTLVQVAELLTIDPPVASRDTIDVTSHDSADGAAEVIVEGIYDPGEIKGQVHYIANSAGDIAMLLAMTGGALQDFKIVLKGASTDRKQEFSGFLTSYGPDGMEVRGKQTASFGAKVSGPITHAADA